MLRKLSSIVLILNLIFIVSSCKLGQDQKAIRTQFDNLITLLKSNEGRSGIFELIDWDAAFAQNAQYYQRNDINSGVDLRKSREEFFNNPGEAMLDNVKKVYAKMGKQVPQLENVPDGALGAEEQRLVDMNNRIFQSRLERDKNRRFDITNIVVSGNIATADVTVEDMNTNNSQNRIKTEKVTFNKKNGVWLLADNIRSSFGILR